MFFRDIRNLHSVYSLLNKNFNPELEGSTVIHQTLVD